QLSDGRKIDCASRICGFDGAVFSVRRTATPMAKAVFQRNQKVWVDSVGAWAIIERIEPVWAKGFEEPVRGTYDVGLGRPFLAHELRPEDPIGGDEGSGEPTWRLMRARNKWQTPDDCAHHPYPGT